mgnify:CR=1 FL=1
MCHLALKRLKLDQIWWMVTPGNPLKDVSTLPELAERVALCRAMVRLFEGMKLAVEPAGAAATAAVWGPLRERLMGKQVGVLVCGANIDPGTFSRLLERGAADPG